MQAIVLLMQFLSTLSEAGLELIVEVLPSVWIEQGFSKP